MAKEQASASQPLNRSNLALKHYACLRNLVAALNGFLDSGSESDGSANPDPHGGLDPDDLECEAVNPGGEIHNAVVALQPFYDGKLPAPDARNHWLLLLRACRQERDKFRRQIEAHQHAGALRDWSENEIAILGKHETADPDRPPAYANYDRDKLIYDSRVAGSTWKEIETALKSLPWAESLTPSGIRNAANVYARRCRKPPLDKGNPGVPKKARE